MRLLFIDRQLELLHHDPHCGHGLVGAAAAADHEVIGIVGYLGSETALVTENLPAENEATHVQIG